MKELILRYRRLIIVLTHILLIASAYLLSFVSRFEFGFFYSPQYMTLFLGTLLPLLVVRLASYWYFDLFKGLWRYVSVGDLLNIIKASVLGTLFFSLYIAIAGEAGFPRSIFVTDLAYNILLSGGIRVAVRIYREGPDKLKLNERFSARNILVVGAGDAGEMRY